MKTITVVVVKKISICVRSINKCNINSSIKTVVYYMDMILID